MHYFESLTKIATVMQQLSLFSTNTRLPRNRQHKQLRKSSRLAHSAVARWDLWTQEADSEKEMALFFLDIRNFTPLVEKHQATDVIHLVKKLFSTFQNIIRIHHGKIIETTGDGFYAAFGFDCDAGDAVNAAIKSGMAILKTLENLNTRSSENGRLRRIDVGIGVHVGKVATGTLLLGANEHFVVMGYPVNVAARLQGSTKELNNNFIVSSAVFNLWTNRQEGAAPITINLKGVTEPCDLHLIGKPYAQ